MIRIIFPVLHTLCSGGACMKQTIALIPSRSPEASLFLLADQLKDAGMTPVIVNDGSADTYTSVYAAAAASAVMISHDEPMGMGTAVKTGLLYVKERIPDGIVLILDERKSCQIKDLLYLQKQAEDHPDAIILAKQKGINSLSSKIAEGVLKVFTGKDLPNPCQCVKAFHTDRIPMLLNVEGSRESYEVNALVTALKHSVPVITEELSETCSEREDRSFPVLEWAGMSLLSACAGSILETVLFMIFSGFFSGKLRYVLASLFAWVFSGALQYEAEGSAKKEDGLFLSLLRVCWKPSVSLAVLLFLIRAGMKPLAAKVLTEGICLLIQAVRKTYPSSRTPISRNGMRA